MRRITRLMAPGGFFQMRAGAGRHCQDRDAVSTSARIVNDVIVNQRLNKTKQLNTTHM